MFYICLEIYSQKSQKFSFTDLHITPNPSSSFPGCFQNGRSLSAGSAARVPRRSLGSRSASGAVRHARSWWGPWAGRYGEGSRRRPGWRSPSISSKPSGANGRGEGTWQGKVLGCRCKFNVYLALFIRYYIYIQLYMYTWWCMYYLVPSATWDPNSRPYACWNRSLDFNDIVVIQNVATSCVPFLAGMAQSHESTRIHHRQAARVLNLWLHQKNAKKLIHKPIQLTISSNLIPFTKHLINGLKYVQIPGIVRLTAFHSHSGEIRSDRSDGRSLR